MIRTVLFDLDGVIRHFDPNATVEIERAHGLSPGTMASAAFARPLLDRVTTGQITRREWIDGVGETTGNKDAAQAWGRLAASADPAMITLVEEIRGLGLTTAILTNGTDTIPDELASLGVADQFDRVFNSAEIGFAKPDRRAFEHVLSKIGSTGAEVFFTDDSVDMLAGARALGMVTHLFVDALGLRRALREQKIAV